MKNQNKQAHWAEKIGSILGVAVFAISVIGGIYGFIQWIDERYVQNTQLTILAVNTAMAIYDQRIVDLRAHELYLLEFEPTNKEELKFTREEIKSIKTQRRSFLGDGNYTTGDNILINKNMLKKLKGN